MAACAAAVTINVSHQARLSYIALSSLRRTFSSSASSAAPPSGHFQRSDFTGQPFTGSYEAGLPPSGPLGDASVFGVPQLTPKALKHHLDQFVVGQERAKRVLSVAVYNHYQRIQELQRRDDEQEEIIQQQTRREMGHRQAMEEGFPAQQQTINMPGSQRSNRAPPLGASPIMDYTPLTIEKSNIMMLGPSGVGKTLMAKTLARILEVPFSMSDCTPFTQAGYIGEDADVCVQRLLAASNYDVSRAERGIICLDEVDKIATAKVSHGKDVSGEGVQQALLKIIEGTTLQISTKHERGAGRGGSQAGGGLGGASSSGSPGGAPGKNEVFNVRTDNILFIFTGAFIGLHKLIMERVSRGSIGFGQPVRASQSDSSHSGLGKGAVDNQIFEKHLPFFTPSSTSSSEQQYNTLDLVEPSDLQKYGLIPELVGRIPITTALSSLDEEALVRVLTEPRNSLLRQYEQLFRLSGVELRVTSPALREIAKGALGMGTGARGLRTVLERLLGDAMFEAPGSSVRYVLVTEAVARRKQAPVYFARGQQGGFHAMIAAEEEDWETKRRQERGEETDGEAKEKGGSRNFEQYRRKAKVASGSA